MFSGIPRRRSTVQAWTVPFEYGCYVMALIMVFRLRKPGLIVFGVVVLLGLGLALNFTGTLLFPPSCQPASQARCMTRLQHGARTRCETAGRCLLATRPISTAIVFPMTGAFSRPVRCVCLGAILLGPAPWMTQPVLTPSSRAGAGLHHGVPRVSNLPRLPLFSNGDYPTASICMAFRCSRW